MISKQKIALQSKHLLCRHDLFKAPINVFDLIERMGLVVMREPMEEEMCGFIKIEGDDAVVVVNSIHNTVRQRFAAAHEVGHYCLHRKGNDEPMVFIDESFTTGIVDSRKNRSRNVFNQRNNGSIGTDWKEAEANRFAASLLIPDSLVEDCIDRWMVDVTCEIGIKRLSNKFEVSEQLFCSRLASMGINYL